MFLSLLYNHQICNPLFGLQLLSYDVRHSLLHTSTCCTRPLCYTGDKQEAEQTGGVVLVRVQ